MKYFILFGLLFLSGFYANAQIIYIDVLKAEMIRLHGNKVQDGVEETGRTLSGVKAKGAYIQTKLNTIKQSHSKLQKGLQDVSSLVLDGFTTKTILEISADIVHKLDDTRKIALRYPQYVVFANGAINRTHGRLLSLSGYVTALSTNSKEILMDAGERKDILNNILFEVRILRASITQINHSIERSAQIGFLQSMNPFNNYVSRDENIMRKIMKDASAYR